MQFSHFVIFRFVIYVLDGEFIADFLRPTGWTHIVLNYIGPNDGQGIRGFVNGKEVASDTTKTALSYPPGEGKIVVGRHFTDQDRLHMSMMVDELLFFNQTLSTTDIKLLYNAV